MADACCNKCRLKMRGAMACCRVAKERCMHEHHSQNSEPFNSWRRQQRFQVILRRATVWHLLIQLQHNRTASDVIMPLLDPKSNKLRTCFELGVEFHPCFGFQPIFRQKRHELRPTQPNTSSLDNLDFSPRLQINIRRLMCVSSSEGIGQCVSGWLGPGAIGSASKTPEFVSI
jgi:hypothetical protein